jgi:hypothetical protein
MDEPLGMTEIVRNRPSLRNYFVDEAGDPVLFNSKKQVVVGTEGCSTYFILGLLDIADSVQLDREMAELRSRLMSDSYLKSVPSMQLERQKTAIAFHAKDDIPEVRREVYALLMRHEMRFFAVIRDKHRIVRLVQEHNKRSPRYRYQTNQLYDRCVSRLFKERLHKDDGYTICFSKRGAKDRTAALKAALETARNNFRHSWGIQPTGPIDVCPMLARQSAGLQAVDYFLWALQRLYERGEARYWEFVWSAVSLVHDVDDIGQHDYGEYYTQKNPLTAAIGQQKKPGI